jgi:hypothetical protein
MTAENAERALLAKAPIWHHVMLNGDQSSKEGVSWVTRRVEDADNRARSSIWHAKVSLPCATRTLRLMPRIDVEHDRGNLSPISAVSLCVEQTQIRDGMLLIVAGKGL